MEAKMSVISEIAVINSSGEVWAADLDLDNAVIGTPFKLNGNLFGQSAVDGFSVWSGVEQNDETPPNGPLLIYNYPYIAVVNHKTGRLWIHQIDALDPNSPGKNIGTGQEVPGSQLFSTSVPKYFVPTFGIYTINSAGEVWTHDWDGIYEYGAVVPNPSPVLPGNMMNGPSIIGSPDTDFSVVVTGSEYYQSWGSLSVVTTSGQVYGHQLMASSAPGYNPGTPDTIGAGQWYASINNVVLPEPALNKFAHDNDLFWVDTNYNVWWLQVPWWVPGPAQQISATLLSGGPSLFGAGVVPVGQWGRVGAYGMVVYNRGWNTLDNPGGL
jgi:hypothetical protein